MIGSATCRLDRAIGQDAGTARGYVNHHEHGRTQVGRQLANELQQHFDRPRGTADDDDVVTVPSAIRHRNSRRRSRPRASVRRAFVEHGEAADQLSQRALIDGFGDVGLKAGGDDARLVTGTGIRRERDRGCGAAFLRR